MTPIKVRPAGFRPRRSGFTLIELLTVIAIIGILAAIIIPVVGKVRLTAKRTQGLSNLRQITVAGLSYAQENRGRWFVKPDNISTPNGNRNYTEVLSNYIDKWSGEGHAPIWNDPLVGDKNWNNHYAVPIIYFKDYNWNYGANFAPYNDLSKAKSPSRAVLFADIWVPYEGDSGWPNLTIFDTGRPWQAFPNTTNGNQIPDANYGKTSAQIDLRRDPGQAKLGFIDGHVAIVKRQDMKHSMFDPRY